MTFTITLGWWTIPLIVTIVSFVIAWFASSDDVYGIGLFMFGGLAAFVSMITWIIGGFLK